MNREEQLELLLDEACEYLEALNKFIVANDNTLVCHTKDEWKEHIMNGLEETN